MGLCSPLAAPASPRKPDFPFLVPPPVSLLLFPWCQGYLRTCSCSLSKEILSCWKNMTFKLGYQVSKNKKWDQEIRQRSETFLLLGDHYQTVFSLCTMFHSVAVTILDQDLTSRNFFKCLFLLLLSPGGQEEEMNKEGFLISNFAQFNSETMFPLYLWYARHGAWCWAESTEDKNRHWFNSQQLSSIGKKYMSTRINRNHLWWVAPQ